MKKMMRQEINGKAKKLLLVVFSVLLLTSLPKASEAATKTGLASTLIKEWHSEVDRSVCPDYRYPSHQPSLATGKKVYQANCAQCHGAQPQGSVSKMRKLSPEKHFELICGDAKHNFKGKLTIDERWDSLMFYRASVLGYFRKHTNAIADMNSIFGANCAVCHGTRGQGDGNLHKSLYPPPANFTMFERLYTRTDERLFNEISHGIPWTAMPAWKNRHDFDRKADFDEAMIWNLVRYVRQFGHSQEIDRLDQGREKLETYKKELSSKKDGE